MTEQQTSFPLLFKSRCSYSSTPLVRSLSNASSSSSNFQAFVSGSCSDHVVPTRLPLKKLRPQPWQRFFDGEKQSLSPIVTNKPESNSRSTENILGLFNKHAFDGNSPLPMPIQAHIDHLYEQIDTLTATLCEERFRHKQARIQAKTVLADQLRNRERQLDELLEQKLTDHQKELKDQENKYLNLLSEEETAAHEREDKLKYELEFIQRSFHIYKVNLAEDYAEKLQISITKAITEIQKDSPKKNEAFGRGKTEQESTNRKQAVEVEHIREQLKKEIETSSKTSLNQKQMELLQRELDETKLRASALVTLIKDLQKQQLYSIEE